MKNLQKNRIFVWILVAVLMITTCQASVLADENSAESAAKQQAVLMEGETGPSETVNHEAPAGGADENTAAETGSSQSETAETGDAGENPEDDEETDQEEAETPEEEEETETGKDGGDQKSPSEEETETGKDGGDQKSPSEEGTGTGKEGGDQKSPSEEGTDSGKDAGKNEAFDTNNKPVIEKNYDTIVKKTSSVDGDGAVTMTDELYRTDVSISKVDAADSQELAGAKLTVTKVEDAAGEEVSEKIESWISEGTTHEITGLTDGIYELAEDQAPPGYKTAEKITFTIKDGQLVEDGNAADGAVTMTDELYRTDISISKVDAADSQELAGAQLTVYKVKDAAGEEVVSEKIDSWTSKGTIHVITGLTDGTYELAENQAPIGYKKAEPITFEIKEGQLVENGDNISNGVVTMKDEQQYKGSVSISKQVLGKGTELAGAELTVTDQNEEPLDSWTSDGSQHEIEDLTDGTYTLTEIRAPEGYEVAESITFEIKDGWLVENGDNICDGVVTMTDALKKTDISISKVDAADSQELEGAQLTVTKVKDIDGEDVSEEIDSWTSEGTTREITDLTDGIYELAEDQAPPGYKTAEKITFTIKDGKLVEDENAVDGMVTMTDELYTTDVSISKVEAERGEELSGARLTVTKVKDAAGEDVSEEIDSWTSKGTIHGITGLTDGIYELAEDQAPPGYKTAEKITFTIKDGQLVEDENAADGVVTMTDEPYTTDVSISKVDAADSQELAGATLRLTKAGQEQAPEDWTWISDGSVHVAEGLTDGTYTLTETTAPKGYKKAESITFEIKEGQLVENGDNISNGVVTMKDEHYKGGVAISKQVLGKGSELAGAELTVTDQNGEIVDSWTSDGSRHEIEDLTDGTYTLTETSAPEGCEAAESITFEIREGQLVENGGNISGGVVTMTDALKKTDISISKVAAGGEELAGAQLTVTKVKDIDGNEISEEIDSWTSSETAHKITGLTDGTYELAEDQAPPGYKTAEKITFTIKDGKLVEDANAKDGLVTMTGELYTTDVSISKVDAADSRELAGATLSLTKAGQEQAPEEWTWVSDGSVHVVEDLTDGTYTLTETTAPEGYKKAESITFEIKDGQLVEDANAADGVVTMTDELYTTDVSISKVDAADSQELAGATLSLTKAGQEQAPEEWTWVSDGGVHVVEGLTDGTYTLTETAAPEGYKKAKSITFEIRNGQLQASDDIIDGVVTMKDELYKGGVFISKQDLGTGAELKGAELKVTDQNGTEIDSWTSDGSQHEISDLVDGTYTLTESSAPYGYKVTEEITFTMKDGKLVEDSNAKDGVVTMKDEQYKAAVKVSKVEAGGGEGLAGAVLTLTNNDTGAAQTWTSDGKAREIKDLIDGKYTLTEDQAPPGFSKTESIDFEIREGRIVGQEENTVIMEDQYTAIRVSKTDITGEKKLAGAHIQILDAEGRVAAEWDSTKEAQEIIGLQTGVTYTIRETVAPHGYYLTSDTTFILNADGTINTEETTATVKDGVILVEDQITETKILKTDEDLNPISGAGLRIEERKGDLIESWTSSAHGYASILGLKPGVTYFLVESRAPAGYKKAETIAFTIDEKGSVKIKSGKGKTRNGVLIMVDTKASGTSKNSKKGSSVEKDRGARTGDDNNFMLWIAMAAAAAGGILGLVFRRRKRTE